ncbi:outer membrane protein TolC [Nitrosomonas sp. Nm84]|uniref:TolC family protein n=1 Tax=Nitrosomonas sp. Nm84 TaxID=200124 RepID=UPI000D882589|nr:TolC family protein [Nitrosomonas sp. Nm84]PXW88862.1 outer membrane protein TolC [Nitrosomonas sp. Nm84]
MKRAAGMPMIALTVIAITTTAQGQEIAASKTGTAILTQSIPQKTFAASSSRNTTLLPALITETLENNPEIQAAHQEREAAQHRIAPAEALDDPMLEAGVINAPLASSPFNREDMTMKMIGLSQRLPFPGKRGLRKEVASKDADAIEQGYHETVNRVVHDLKTAYFDLGLTLEMIKLVEKNKQTLEHFLHIAEERYQVGQGSQADVLKAQTQVSRMLDRLLGLAREQPVFEAELIRVLGRNAKGEIPLPMSLHIQEVPLMLETLQQEALAQRPQLLALQSLIARSEKSVDLARKAYYPDFDVRLSYGQRDNMLDGTRRDDMVSMTVAVNLPVWRGNKIQPRIMESEAMRDQATSLYQAQSNEIAARLRQQIAMAEQSLKSIKLYQTAILPQAKLTVESALAAYQVNRIDFLTLLDNQMTVFDYQTNLIAAMANYNKALAEIDWLVGKKQH